MATYFEYLGKVKKVALASINEQNPTMPANRLEHQLDLSARCAPARRGHAGGEDGRS